MARKYIRGNPNKNYYDNTKFIGTLATTDPVPEGMFRHLVNFDVSDTGQSITPRRGYLTTSIRYNNEDIVLSNQTIIFRDPEKGKHIIYDYKFKRAFVLNITHSNIEDKRLLAEKEIDVDHIDIYEPFLKEFENIQEKNAELLAGVGVTYNLRASDSATYNSTDYTSNTLVNKNDKYITPDDFDKLHTLIPSWMDGIADFWDADNNRPRVYIVKLPVVLDKTLVGGTHYRVNYFLNFSVSQLVFNSENIQESVMFTPRDLAPDDISHTIEFELPNDPSTNVYTEQIENLLRVKYRNSVDSHSDTSRTKIVKVSSVTIIDGTPTTIEIYAYKYRFHYTYISVASVVNASMFKNVTIEEYDDFCVTTGTGKLVGTQLEPVKDYTDNYVVHKGELTSAYKDVRFPSMLCFDNITPSNAANQILTRLSNTVYSSIPKLGTSKIFNIAIYNKNNTVVDEEFKLSPITSRVNYKVEWSKSSTTRKTLAQHNINKPGGTYYYNPVTESEMNTGEVVPTVIQYDNKPTIFIDTRKYGFLNPNNLEKSLEDLLTPDRIFDEIKNKPEFFEALKYQSNPATFYLEAVAKHVISSGGRTSHILSGFIVKVTITLTASSSNTTGVKFYETRPAVLKPVLYAKQLSLQYTKEQIYNMYDRYEKYKYVNGTDVYVENLNGFGKAYCYTQKIPGIYFTPYTHKEETDEFKTDVVDAVKDNIKYLTSITQSYVDSYGISRVLNKATFIDKEKRYPVILTYKYTGKKLLVGALSMQEQSSIFRPNLASRNSVIPDVMQRVYDVVNRPYGHVNYTPYVFITDGTKYYTNYINPSVNYKFIPHFHLNPPELTANDEFSALAWAVRIEVRSGTDTVYSYWYDLETRAAVINVGEDLLKYDDGLIYTDMEAIRNSGITPSQVTVSFFFMPYDKEVEEYDSDDAAAWNLQSIKETSGVAVATYDPQLLKSTIPTDIPDDVEHIRNTSTYTIYEDNRLVMWFENSVWIADPGVGYFAEENKHVFNERVVKVLPFRDTLLVFTVENLYVIYPSEIEQQTGTKIVGEGENAKEEPVIEKVKIYVKQAVLYNILVSDKYKNVIQVFNQNILFYSEEGQLYLIRPSTQIDSDTRYTLQMFNKNVNDILLNYDKYINERLEQYFMDNRVTKEDVRIDALVSINDIKIFFFVPGVITYILKYNVLTNQFTVYDTVTFNNINSLHFIEGGEMYITEMNERRYITLPYTAFYEDDNNVDMTHYDNYKREPINALLDTGNINLNNHINKRFRDMHVVFKNLDTYKLLFNSETIIDDVISHPFKNLYVEVQELNGNKIIVPVEDMNTIDILEVTHDATGSFGLLFDFKEFLSNRLITYKTSILGTGKVFRLRMQFISKGIYKIQEFGIIYRERSV